MDSTAKVICLRCEGEDQCCASCDGTGFAPRIVGSALRRPSGRVISLPAPARHHDVIRHMGVLGYTRDQIARCEQGFVTNLGDWVRRVPAKCLAEEAGQIIMDSCGGRRELFSEDVW